MASGSQLVNSVLCSSRTVIDGYLRPCSRLGRIALQRGRR